VSPRLIVASLAACALLPWAVLAADRVDPGAAGIAIPEIAPGPAITLAEALQRADRNSPTLAAARADIERAEAELAASWGRLVPAASGSLGYTYNDHADFASPGGGTEVEIRSQETATLSLQLRVPLVRPQSWLATHAARAGVRVGELGAEATRQALLLTTAQAYFQALTARALIEVQQSQVAAARRHLSVSEIRLRSGTGSRLDMIRARTDLLAAQEALLLAHTAYEGSRDALRTLIRSDALPAPAGEPGLAPPALDEPSLLQQASAAREDLRLARAAEDLAERQVLASSMAYLPSLDASWQLNYQITDPAGFSSTDQSRWFLGLTLTVPLYDHVNTAALQQSLAARRRAELELEQAELDAAREVRQALRAFREALVLVGTAQTKAGLAGDALELAETAYENGTGDSLDVTDARRSSRAAESDLATRRFDAQLSLLELLRATGGDVLSLVARGGAGT